MLFFNDLLYLLILFGLCSFAHWVAILKRLTFLSLTLHWHLKYDSTTISSTGGPGGPDDYDGPDGPDGPCGPGGTDRLGNSEGFHY